MEMAWPAFEIAQRVPASKVGPQRVGVGDLAGRVVEEDSIGGNHRSLRMVLEESIHLLQVGRLEHVVGISEGHPVTTGDSHPQVAGARLAAVGFAEDSDSARMTRRPALESAAAVVRGAVV